MQWKWKIAQIKGIDIYLHTTFLFLLALIALDSLLHGSNVIGAAGSIVTIAALFSIVVMHELGHALAARRFGIATRDITLLPIGGVASLERMPEDPKAELAIALAGPAVNIALAALFAIMLAITTGMADFADVNPLTGGILSRLIGINVGLALFNLLPAFPMDGGRVLRALMGFWKDYVSATRIAASVGKVMAVAFGIIGLYANPMLVFIALFVWFAGSQEYAMVKAKYAYAGASSMFTDIFGERYSAPHRRSSHPLEGVYPADRTTARQRRRWRESSIEDATYWPVNDENPRH
ncbi:MAG: site-2 protease family protein [Chitinivibrionales bacterium]|nr:site-2 protease family protein [Chitinivibrionales bacterium]